MSTASMVSIALVFPLETPLLWHGQFSNWLGVGTCTDTSYSEAFTLDRQAARIGHRLLAASNPSHT